MSSMYLPITNKIFNNIITLLTMSLKDYNINIVFKTAWAKFLYSREIIYIMAKLRKLIFMKIYDI